MTWSSKVIADVIFIYMHTYILICIIVYYIIKRIQWAESVLEVVTVARALVISQRLLAEHPLDLESSLARAMPPSSPLLALLCLQPALATVFVSSPPRQP